VLAYESSQYAGKVAHSGVILAHRNASKGCLDYWRLKMEKGTHDRNQELLRDMMKLGVKSTGFHTQT
jgi:hypothetical protein